MRYSSIFSGENGWEKRDLAGAILADDQFQKLHTQDLEWIMNKYDIDPIKVEVVNRKAIHLILDYMDDSIIFSPASYMMRHLLQNVHDNLLAKKMKKCGSNFVLSEIGEYSAGYNFYKI